MNRLDYDHNGESFSLPKNGYGIIKIKDPETLETNPIMCVYDREYSALPLLIDDKKKAVSYMNSLRKRFPECTYQLIKVTLLND